MARQTPKPPARKRKPAGKRPQTRGRAAAARKRRNAASDRTKVAANETTRRLPPPKAPARKPREPSPPALGEDRIRDVWGIGLFVLAVLSALALWGDEAAGTLGIWLEGLFRGLFGVVGLVAPVAIGLIALALLREPSPFHRRLGLGLTVIVLAVTGLYHLSVGAPPFSAEPATLQRSGGWVGAGLTLPLRQFVGAPGAIVVLVALIAIGLCVATATPPRAVGRALTGVAHAAGSRVVRRRQPGEDQPAIDLPEPEAPPPDDTQPLQVQYEGVDDREEEPAALSDTQLLPRGVELQPARRDGRATAQKLTPPDDDWAGYELPPMRILRPGKSGQGNRKALDQMQRALIATLKQFNVEADVTKVSRGPTVTRFELSLKPGTKVSAVTKLADDISYALATAEIRIVSPIPGKSAIGIEVPNRDRDLVTLGDVLRSAEAAAALHPLTAGIGVDIAGNPLLVNLATMPHLLIAGATGSGKSVTMNGVVTSMIMRATPAQVRMILVDPKRVELNHYEGAPHLLTPVVTDPKRATEALAWTVKEMEDRYERLALLGYRNLDAYNKAVSEGTVRTAPALSGRADEAWRQLPYILFVIDELADLMMVAPRDVESQIVRIAQMARAVGIHLIVATQRPSVDVVTGLIKANIPSRIALAMATQADSRTILDAGGAEKLVGHGDMLFLPANASKPHRIQGCFVEESEIEQIVKHCKAQRSADYAAGVVREGADAYAADVTGDDASDEDLTRAAMDLVVRSGLGSTSMLQRKLKVGFARAGRIMDELETMGVVGPSEGSKARTVLLTIGELEQRLSSLER